MEVWEEGITQNEFAVCCNEFWWCLNNIAKGLWREEIPYVQKMYYDGCHVQLVKLLNWEIGYETDFQISTGKVLKYMNEYLPEELWNRFLKTYISGNIDEIWASAFTMCDLFADVARELEKCWGHVYNSEEAEASYGFLRHVHGLPKDAEQIL